MKGLFLTRNDGRRVFINMDHVEIMMPSVEPPGTTIFFNANSSEKGLGLVEEIEDILLAYYHAHEVKCEDCNAKEAV